MLEWMNGIDMCTLLYVNVKDGETALSMKLRGSQYVNKPKFKSLSYWPIKIFVQGYDKKNLG
jgi:hypothetical protein